MNLSRLSACIAELLLTFRNAVFHELEVVHSCGIALMSALNPNDIEISGQTGLEMFNGSVRFLNLDGARTEKTCKEEHLETLKEQDREKLHAMFNGSIYGSRY